MLSYSGSVVKVEEPRQVKTKRGLSVVQSILMLDQKNPTAVYRADFWGDHANGIKLGNVVVMEVSGVRPFGGVNVLMGVTLRSVDGKPVSGA